MARLIVTVSGLTGISGEVFKLKVKAYRQVIRVSSCRRLPSELRGGVDLMCQSLFACLSELLHVEWVIPSGFGSSEKGALH